MVDDFESRIVALAERTIRIKAHCAGDDATRIYLVMPFLELLGYDAGDPSVIVPEPDDEIGFAVLADGQPVMAIEAVGSSQPTNKTYERLRAYCQRHGSARLAIATNGLVFEAFIDSEQVGVLDVEPFVRLDLEEVGAAGRVDAEMLAFLRLLRAAEYSADVVTERAFAFGVRERFKSCVLAEFRNPSEAFCRLLLDQIGIRGARTTVIDEHFRPILKAAMEQALIVPVVQALRRLPLPQEPMAVASQIVSEPPPVAVPLGVRLEEELAAFGRAKRRRA